MDKYNRKLKILYKCIKANNISAVWQHMLYIPPTKILRLLTTQTKTKTKRATQKNLPFGDWRFRGGKRSGEWAQNKKRIR